MQPRSGTCHLLTDNRISCSRAGKHLWETVSYNSYRVLGDGCARTHGINESHIKTLHENTCRDEQAPENCFGVQFDAL